MKRFSFMTLFMFTSISILLSCALFQKSSRDSSNSSSKSETKLSSRALDSIKQSRDMEFLVFRNNAVNVDSWLEVWPKGRFTFSSEKGFEGEAEKIVLVDKRTELSEYNAHKKEQEELTGLSDHVTDQQQTVASATKLTRREKAPSSNWWGFGFLILVLLGYVVLIYPQLKSINKSL